MQELQLSNFKTFKSVGICLHDAGAANQIIALLKENEPEQINVFAKGPAQELWEEAFGLKMFCDHIDEMIDRSEIVISGTGWATDVEKRGIVGAIKQHKRCIAYFDHWTNYSSRLILNGERLRPSAIWVSDDDASRLAVKYHPNIPVIQVPNYYLNNEAAKISPLRNKDYSVLYVCEPIFKQDISSLELTLEPIYFAIEQLRSGCFGNISKFIIRPHPSQKSEIFFPFLTEEANFQIEISDAKSLAEDISAASKVIGLNSFALVIAAAANREIFCSAPPSWRQSKLKLQNFRYLRDL